MTKIDWSRYEVRTGRDGKSGIYLRSYNVRLATFNAGTVALQKQLGLLFEQRADEIKIHAAAGRPIGLLDAVVKPPRKFKIP